MHRCLLHAQSFIVLLAFAGACDKGDDTAVVGDSDTDTDTDADSDTDSDTDTDTDTDGDTDADSDTDTDTDTELFLSEADAKLVGEDAGDMAGYFVAGAFDANGDGNDDLLLGVYEHGEGVNGAGAAYLVLGPVSGTVDLSLSDAKLVGEEENDYAGHGVASGDVDDDGHDDLFVGSLQNEEGGSGAGAAYLVLGPVSGTLDLSLADAKLVGEAFDTVGTVSVTGDVDGDGRADLLMGAPNNDEGGVHAGAAYVFQGPVVGNVDVSLADATLVGEAAGDNAGYAVSGAGDVDGDGRDDLLVGAQANEEGGAYAGAAYLILGPASGHVDLQFADAKLVGEGMGHLVGATNSLSGAGDVDADGHADLLVGAWNSEKSAGSAYLVLGPVTGTLDLSLADAKLTGESPMDYAGSCVAAAGDVNADGNADVLVGAYYNEEGATFAGAAYVIFGDLIGTSSLAAADAKLLGDDYGQKAGSGLAGAGDMDGDGRADVLIGAIADDEGGSQAGAAFLVRGSRL